MLGFLNHTLQIYTRTAYFQDNAEKFLQTSMNSDVFISPGSAGTGAAHRNPPGPGRSARTPARSQTPNQARNTKKNWDGISRIRVGGGGIRPAGRPAAYLDVLGLEPVDELAEEIPELAEGEEQPVAEQRGQRRRVWQPHHLAPSLIPTGSPPGSGSETPPELPAEIIGLFWPESSLVRIRILG